MRRNRNRLALVSVLVLALAAAPACSQRDTGDDDVASVNGGATPAAPTSAVAEGDQGRRFAQCVRENGIPDFADPAADGTLASPPKGTDPAVAQKALEACRDLMPAGVGAAPNAQQLDQARNLARCMREHGVNVPDPDPNAAGGAAIGAMPGIDTKDPKVQEALRTCQQQVGLPSASAGPR